MQVTRVSMHATAIGDWGSAASGGRYVKVEAESSCALPLATTWTTWRLRKETRGTVP